MFQPATKNVVNRPPPQRVQNAPPYECPPRFRTPVNKMRNFPQRGNVSHPPMMGPHGLPPHVYHPGNVILFFDITVYYTLINLGSVD